MSLFFFGLFVERIPPFNKNELKVQNKNFCLKTKLKSWNKKNEKFIASPK